MSLTRFTQTFRGKHTPHPGFMIFAATLFVSSGWVNVLLWVVTGRQFGFTAASVRTLSQVELYRGPVEEAPAHGDQIRRRPEPEGFELQDQRESGDVGIVPRPPFRPLPPSELAVSPTLPHPNYAYQPLAQP